MDRDNNKKVNKITINIVHEDYENFKLKSYEDGYSMQTAIKLLIESYSKDKLIIR